MELFGQVLCSCSPLRAQLGYSEYGLFCFLGRGLRLAPVFQKQTSFDFVLLARLKRWVFWSGSFRRVPLRLLFVKVLGVALVLHWDVKWLQVLLTLLGSYHMEHCVPWLLVFLQLLDRISSCRTWLILSHT
jgi:hypothetical protein